MNFWDYCWGEKQKKKVREALGLILREFWALS